jgi:hypothetical protein
LRDMSPPPAKYAQPNDREKCRNSLTYIKSNIEF